MTKYEANNKSARGDAEIDALHPRYRADIDGLRAIAVLGVVLYHLNADWLPGGFAGVDVFFVISGYLISLIVFRELDAGKFSFPNFYARRARRLFPALILVITAALFFGWFSLFADEFELLGRHIYSAVIFLANYRLMGEAGYFDVASHLKPLLHLWSLAIEEQFYLVWPLLLVIFTRIKSSRQSLLIGSLVLSSLVSYYYYTQSPTVHFFNPLSRFWELLCGACLAYITLYKPSVLSRINRRSSVFGLLGLILILVSYVGLSAALIYPSAWALLPVMGSVLIIAVQGGASAKILAWRPLVYVGLISYPLYLWHWPVLSYLRIVESGKPSLPLLCIGVIVAVLLSIVTYHLIEKKFRYAKSSAVLVGLCLSLVALFLIGNVIKANDGFADRSVLNYLNVSKQQMTRAPRSDDKCVAYVAPNNPPVYCRLTPGRDLLAIIGDSHAHVLFSGLAEYRAKLGLGTILLANSGCPPFMGSAFGRSLSERAACVESVERILKQVVDDVSVEDVLMATRGPQYIDGLGFGPAEKNYNYPPLTDATGLPKSPVEVFEGGVTNTITKLQVAGKRVSYFLQVPELGVSPRDCLGRPLSFFNKTSCYVSRAEYELRMRDYRAIMNRVAQDRKITLFDPENMMCSEGKCHMMSGGVLMYADDNHLSLEGSRRLAPRISNFIDNSASSVTDAASK